jgi:superfamily I DNA/RNA helicase
MGELIIDEGQDLPPCVYDVLPSFFRRTFVGADNGQQVHPNHGAKAEQISASLNTSFQPHTPFRLGRNWRNTYATYAFARQFAPKTNLTVWDENILERLRRTRPDGPKPTVVGYRSDEERNRDMAMRLRNADGRVAILCALCEEVDAMYEFIKAQGLPVSKYHSNSGLQSHPVATGPGLQLQRYLVTTYMSIKGMECDVAIIPRLNFWKRIPEEWYVHASAGAIVRVSRFERHGPRSDCRFRS